MRVNCLRWRKSLLASMVIATGFLGCVAQAVSLEPVARIETGLFDEGASEIVAYNPRFKVIYVTNAFTNSIDVYWLRRTYGWRPWSPRGLKPIFIRSIDMSPYGDGPTSVATSRRLGAVAMENADSQAPGKVVFFKAPFGPVKAVVEVSALPDMLTFTPNGRHVLVACEGEPLDYCEAGLVNDPEGVVSIIDVPRSIRRLDQDDVRTVSFTSFNNSEIDPKIRIFGPNATVAQDLEPEYIAVSRNSKTAFVCLQENNALAVIDIKAGEVKSLVGLGFKDFSTPQMGLLEKIPFDDIPVLGTTVAGQEIHLGGFSGLHFEGINPDNGNLMFITHPDRGPNADTLNGLRPFPLPDYQAQFVKFEVSPEGGPAEITEIIPLTAEDGLTPITGLPNLPGPAGLKHKDEIPVDLFLNELQRDPLGADMEGIVRVEDGTYWMVDEYRPAIYHFAADGVLIDRFVPEGSNDGGTVVGTEAFPEVFAQRRANRGFEAVAYDNGTLYAFIQSPIDNPDVSNDANSKSSRIGRILAFDTENAQALAQYIYVFDGNGSDKIGDAVHVGGSEILVIERDSAISLTSAKNVYRIDLAGATDVSALEPLDTNDPDLTIESLSPEQLADYGIVPVAKELFLNLTAAGYDFTDKPEGLTIVDENTIAVLNDNDFQLAGGFDPNTGLLEDNLNPQEPILGLIRLRSNGLDASDDDGEINITNWPVFGMYQPDAIATYEYEGQTYIVTANEGDAREYDCFEEEADVEDVVLDPAKFPNAAELQTDGAMGPLKITTTLGDDDNDGEFERLFAYGARSFSIWNAQGELIWDSGDDLEQITAELLPDDFNSTDDENDSFDNRSDNKGPEPEGVVVGKVRGRTLAFIGLERIGGIMVYDVTVPWAPTFETYVNTRDFAGDPQAGTAGDLAPEGLTFVSAKDSPNRRPLLIVAYEISGSTTIFEVNVPFQHDDDDEEEEGDDDDEDEDD